MIIKQAVLHRPDKYAYYKSEMRAHYPEAD